MTANVIVLSSEDDPERLWCICKQPHNNRFMICCDNCLDWYHGKCVGITKRMGKVRILSCLRCTRVKKLKFYYHFKCKATTGKW